MRENKASSAMAADVSAPPETTLTTEQRHLRSGLLLAIAGTALFGLKSIFIKLAYAEGVDTETLLMLRMLIAFPAYLLMLRWLWRKPAQVRPLRHEWLAVFGMGFLGYYLASWLDMEGLNYISAQLERLTLYTYPIMTTLLGWLFLREVITRRVVLALLLTYSGVILLYLREATQNMQQASWGVLLVALAALSFSCYVVLSKHYITRLGSRLFTSIAMLASTFFVLIHFLITHDLEDLLINNTAWVYAFLLAVFSTLLPSFMVSEAIARIGAARTSIVGTAGPVFTIVLAVILLGEPFGWVHLAGMLLVMSGVSLLRK
jgi:drug/metabolite transporter (DMT)-like permease